MKQNNNNRLAKRVLRHKRVKERIKTAADRPRLAVYKSNAHLFAQLIDDTQGKTLASSSTLQLKLATPNLESATKVGADIGAKAVQLGIKKVAFDTGGSAYHGRLKALADAARAAGLQF